MKKQPIPPKENPDMPLGKKNFTLILIGIGIIALGFVLLSGGGAENPEKEFSEAIFNVRRLYVAPTVLLIGFAFEVYALLYKPKKRSA